MVFPEVSPRPFEQKQRRKWGNPIVADLDRDGYPDLLLNDHGYTVKIYWNNKGHFAAAIDLIVGDIHGIAIADYNDDGLIEAVITRGGGSGSNARNAKLFQFGRDRSFAELPERDPPLRKMRGRTAKWVDGDRDGDLDLLLFGYPAQQQLPDGENDIYENTGKGRLVFKGRAPRTYADDELTLTTDIDSDGRIDLIRYGTRPMSVLRGGKELEWTLAEDVLPGSYPKVTGVVEFDYDNDGDMDLFLARGELPGREETFYDAETKRLGFFVKRGSYQLPALQLGEELRLRSYQAQFPDHKIWVGESAYEWTRPGEWHSAKDIFMRNSDALGMPDSRENRGMHFGYVGNGRWRFTLDVFPPTSGVIEGVPAFTESAHVAPLRSILLRNDGGRFTDATRAAGLDRLAHTMAVAAGDLDNDGRIDLFMVNRGNLIHGVAQSIFLNKGDGTFGELKNHGVVSSEIGSFGMGGEMIDYDQDGWLDLIYGNDRGYWHLHRNNFAETNNNDFVRVKIGRSPSGTAGAQGALAQIEGCGIRQMRRIGASGAPYSQTLDTLLQFGVGRCRAAQQVTVTWGNGETGHYEVSRNQTLEAGG